MGGRQGFCQKTGRGSCLYVSAENVSRRCTLYRHCFRKKNSVRFVRPYIVLVVMASSILFVSSCKDDDPGDYMGPDFSCQPPDADLFALPYPIGQSYTLLQGNCTSRTHSNELRYAFDFAMPIGSPVTAAFGGVINYVEENYSDGDGQEDHANVVTVDHEDGTFGRYMHLTKNGVLVEVGMRIERGDTIALSGKTGFAIEPMLHFDVAKCQITCNSAETVPVGFANTSLPVDQEGTSYLAEPY